MQAVINISSEGTRLRPLSCSRCVGMIEICDRAIAHQMVECLKRHGVDEVIFITDYMHEGVKEYFKDGEDFGCRIKYVTSTAGDLALREMEKSLAETFVYASKSVYADFDLSEVVEFHKAKHSFVTVLTSRGINGGIVCDKAGRVTRIEEKRMWNSLFGKQGTGVFIMSRDVVKFLPSKGEAELTESVLPAIVRAGKAVYTKNVRGVCEAVSDVASFMRANLAHLDFIKKTIKGGIKVEEGARVEKGALLEAPCYIGKNAHIHKGAKVGAYTSVGEGSIVGEGVSIKRSIIGKNCHLGRFSALRGCVLDDRVRLGEAVTVYEQAIIGQNTHLENNVTVKSFVKIWPEKTVEAGTIVNQNLMWGQKKRMRLFEKGEIKGIVNVDINPVFCSMLGSVLGLVYDGNEVGISSDGSPVGAMLRDGIVSGLIASGCHVKDFGEQPLPITRRGVAFYMLKGAVCINVRDCGGEDVAHITLLGENGFDMDEKTKLKAEELFEKGNFVYPEASAVSECEYVFEYKIYYLKSIVGYDKKKPLSKKLLVSCGANWGRRLIASAMADFDCPVSMYSPVVDDDLSGIGAFEEAVSAGGFDMGFVLDSRCEKLIVVLPTGRIDDVVYEVITSLIVMKKYNGAKIYVPVTASSAIDRLAEKYSCDVIRTRTTPIEIMRHMSGEEKYLTEEFAFRFDAVAALVLLVEYMAQRGTDLQALLKEVPDVAMAQAVIEMPRCDTEVILANIKSTENVQNAPEGVKIAFDKGWVLIIPDAEKEVFRVVSEGAKAEVARELCDVCVEKLIKAQKNTP